MPLVECAEDVATEPKSDPATLRGAAVDPGLDASCQRRALRCIGNKAWEHLDASYDQLCGNLFGSPGAYTERVCQEAKQRGEGLEATFKVLCERHLGHRGQTYTQRVNADPPSHIFISLCHLSSSYVSCRHSLCMSLTFPCLSVSLSFSTSLLVVRIQHFVLHMICPTRHQTCSLS